MTKKESPKKLFANQIPLDKSESIENEQHHNFTENAQVSDADKSEKTLFMKHPCTRYGLNIGIVLILLGLFISTTMDRHTTQKEQDALLSENRTANPLPLIDAYHYQLSSLAKGSYSESEMKQKTENVAKAREHVLKEMRLYNLQATRLNFDYGRHNKIYDTLSGLYTKDTSLEEDLQEANLRYLPRFYENKGKISNPFYPTKLGTTPLFFYIDYHKYLSKLHKKMVESYEGNDVEGFKENYEALQEGLVKTKKDIDRNMPVLEKLYDKYTKESEKYAFSAKYRFGEDVRKSQDN